MMPQKALLPALLQSALVLCVACTEPASGDSDRTEGESLVGETKANPDLAVEDPNRPVGKPEAQRVSELTREQRMAKRRELSSKHVERLQAEAPQSPRGEVPEDVLDRIIADLAEKIGAKATAIQVVVATATVWSDGALGCPAPGSVYTHAPVPGYRVILNHDGQRYHYHADERGPFMLCEQPTLQPPPQPGELTAKQ